MESTPACVPQLHHDRYVPETLDGHDRAPQAADGLLGCMHCGERVFYCSHLEGYYHVDPEGGECPPVHRIVQDAHPYGDPVLNADGTPTE